MLVAYLGCVIVYAGQYFMQGKAGLLSRWQEPELSRSSSVEFHSARPHIASLLNMTHICFCKFKQPRILQFHFTSFVFCFIFLRVCHTPCELYFYRQNTFMRCSERFTSCNLLRRFSVQACLLSDMSVCNHSIIKIWYSRVTSMHFRDVKMPRCSL